MSTATTPGEQGIHPPFRLKRHGADDCRALLVRQDFQIAAVLSKPLAHTGDAYSDEGPVTGLLRRLGAGHPTAVVSNLQG